MNLFTAAAGDSNLARDGKRKFGPVSEYLYDASSPMVTSGKGKVSERVKRENAEFPRVL
jgi:hypothetical protein